MMILLATGKYLCVYSSRQQKHNWQADSRSTIGPRQTQTIILSEWKEQQWSGVMECTTVQQLTSQFKLYYLCS